jgi:hypothetical protein
MSDQSKENARYVTCRCQHCGGHIEFDANELNGAEMAKVECPHCHLKTPIFAGKASFPPPVQNLPDVLNPPPVKRRVVISIVTSLVGIFLISVVAFWSEPTHKPGDFFPMLFGLIMMAVLFCGAVLLYFLPSILAWKKKKVNRAAIFVLNFGLGWTLIGWFVALIWATAQDDRI